MGLFLNSQNCAGSECKWNTKKPKEDSIRDANGVLREYSFISEAMAYLEILIKILTVEIKLFSPHREN